jgi:glycosyltransferase involved in cell wall biosynthesis
MGHTKVTMLRARPTLHWVCQSPSPYNDVLFRALATECAVDLRVHYLRGHSEEYCWTLGAEKAYWARAYRRRLFDWTVLVSVLGDRTSIFLTGCWQDPTCQVALVGRMLLRMPYLVWNDTPMPRLRRGIGIKERLRSRFLRVVFRNALAVLGTGVPALEIFSRMGAPSGKLVNFPYCVDVEKFLPGAKRACRPTIVFGSCCRLHESKGIDVVLRALKRFAKSGHAPFLYRIAGEGPERERLTRLVEELELGPCVEFCGWVGAEELPAYYRSLDVFVHAARFEPYGVTVIEALSSGLPVLASLKTMAAIDRVVDGKNGFLHREGDEVDLYRSMVLFANLPISEREQMAGESRKAALQWTVAQARETIDRLVARVALRRHLPPEAAPC